MSLQIYVCIVDSYPVAFILLLRKKKKKHRLHILKLKMHFLIKKGSVMSLFWFNLLCRDDSWKAFKVVVTWLLAWNKFESDIIHWPSTIEA